MQNKMKFPVIALILLFSACDSNHSRGQQKMQQTIDSLEKELNQTYKPGFGEFISGIQTHHAKLLFAGINNNWELADFEIHEIEEALEDIQKFNTDRPESKSIGMINPPLDSVINAIKQQSPQLFKSSYTLLTNTCNNCHKATEHGFNVITIPTTPPLSNQSFQPSH
jgi:hypothetical protein